MPSALPAFVAPIDATPSDVLPVPGVSRAGLFACALGQVLLYGSCKPVRLCFGLGGLDGSSDLRRGGPLGAAPPDALPGVLLGLALAKGGRSSC